MSGAMTARPGHGHWFHSAWSTLAVFSLISLVCSIDQFILGALLTPIKESLGLADEQLGRLSSAFVIAYIVVIPFSAHAADRLSRKPLILGALLLWSLATLGSGMATSFDSLLVWRALVGLGEGVFASLSQTWIADTFGVRRRSIAFAAIMSTSQLAAWMAYYYGGLIAAHSDWHHAFFIAGAPGLLLAVVFIFLREPAPGASEAVTLPPSPPAPSEILKFIRSTDYLLYLGGFTVRMIAVAGFFFWGAVMLYREYGLSNQDATSFMGSAYLLTGTPGIFLAGFLAGRLSIRYHSTYACWLVAGEILAGLAVAYVLLARPEWQLARWIILSQMFFAGNSWGVIRPLLFQITPVHLRNSAVGLSVMATTGLGTVLAGQLIGWVSDFHGIRSALLLVPSSYFVAAALWLALAIRQKRRPSINGTPDSNLPTPSSSCSTGA